MSSLNKVILVGRLTRDPDLRYIQSGEAVANFTLAVDRPFTNQKGEKETDFVRIVVWKKQAENCAQYLNKGSMAAVDGRLQVRNYEDNSGEKKQAVEVVAERVVFIGGKKQDNPEISPAYDDSDVAF